MRLSLRYRLLLPLTLLLVGELAATAWAAESAARGADRRLAEQLWGIARTLTEPRTFPLTDRVLQQMKGLTGAEFLLVRRGGVPVGTFSDAEVAPPSDVPAVHPSSESDAPPLGSPVAVGQREYRCLRLPLRPPHPNAGDDLYIFYPESLRRTAMWDAARPPLVLGIVGGLIAFGLAFASGSWIVRRIRDLDLHTRQIAAGDFRPMPLPNTEDELKDLCRSVNDMARRLAGYQDAQQRSERLRLLGQFSGGLAHQLRNAAAGAKLAIELFLAENPSADPEPLQVALRQLVRIESNLRQFLDLGKPPFGAKQPCDLRKLIDQAVSLLRPQCQHTGISLIWEPGDSATLDGDPGSLGHLFGNVIGNAVEAAGPGGSVEVRLAATRSGASVEVTDTGLGPPPEIAAKLFEPFVTGKSEGIGLGLAVAKQAADAHGGRIAWEHRDGRTAFRIEFPTPPEHGRETAAGL